ncbi:MAG: hypothetical protein NXI27_15205 [Alphaproteobacteria bacterium]|nr:hypothetical protein [Alphaproteobacteria bacterium]
MEILDHSRLLKTKRAFSTRRVPEDRMITLLSGPRRPRSGDLVLARVETVGSHKRIELPNGRRALLSEGDEIILAYGDRYAPDQYEAYVPEDIDACHMVAAGGIAARAASWHDRLSGPTEIEPLGLVGDGTGQPVNLMDFALPAFNGPMPVCIFAVFGTSMNAGKTTTAAALVKGFSEAGCRVGAAKVTGTGAGGDLWMMRDFGAAEVLDFTDAGYPTTFGTDHQALLTASRNLIGALGARGCGVAVIEIADGLYQDETAALAASTDFRSLLSGTFFAAGDAMGAVAGSRHLAELGHEVLGISGSLTRSPLSMREAVAAAQAPVLTLPDLINPAIAAKWLAGSNALLAAGE